MKKLAIEQMNNDNLFNGDFSLSSEGKEDRQTTQIGEFVKEQIDGLVISIDQKEKKQTMINYDVSMLYNGIFVKVEFIERIVNDKKSYKINIVKSEADLSDDDKEKILLYLIHN